MYAHTYTCICEAGTQETFAILSSLLLEKRSKINGARTLIGTRIKFCLPYALYYLHLFPPHSDGKANSAVTVDVLRTYQLSDSVETRSSLNWTNQKTNNGHNCSWTWLMDGKKKAALRLQKNWVLSSNNGCPRRCFLHSSAMPNMFS